LFILQILADIGAEKIARGTADAFAAFYEKYLPRVFRYISYRINDSHTAEDLTSVVFEKALTKFKTYSAEKATFATWVFTIARNTLTDHFRSMGKAQVVQLDESTEMFERGVSPEEELIKSEQCRVLQTCVSRLSHNEQEIISLKFGADMTNRQIAGMLGLSESNVGIILYRAVRKLRDDFKGWKDE
jgi:RNA polymerase sigma-70 factor, ECF subfamily